MFSDFPPGAFPCEPAPKKSWWDKFKYNLQSRIDFYHFKYLVWCGYIAMDGTPLRCEACSYWKLDDIVTDRIDYTPCEVKIVCPKCNNECGYWAYGHWEPRF